MSNITIIMADPSDAGGYACNATNAAGRDTAAAELTVHGKEPSLTFLNNLHMNISIFYSHTQHHLPGR